MSKRLRTAAACLLLLVPASAWSRPTAGEEGGNGPNLRMSTMLFSSAPAPAPATIAAPLHLRTASTLRRSLIRVALQRGQAMLGIDYVFGANRDDAVDCSSLVQRMFAAAGMRVPRTTRQQVRLGRRVKATELTAGDLLFYRWGPSGLHVAVYLEDNRILHASTGAGEVVVSELNTLWHQHMVTARRLL